MTLFNGEEMRRAVVRLAAEAAEECIDINNLALVGIRTRGVVLASRMKREIERIEGVCVPLGILDISLYRDDLLSDGCDAVFKGSEMDFSVDGKEIALCDDVLFTGRTVRAALAALASMGRAKSIRLYTLVDRGRRELPFRADGIGKTVSAPRTEKVVVHFLETDGEDCVRLEKQA